MPRNVPKVDGLHRVYGSCNRGTVFMSAERQYSNGTFPLAAQRMQAAQAECSVDGHYDRVVFWGNDNTTRTPTDVRIAVYKYLAGTATQVAMSDNMASQVIAGPRAVGVLNTSIFCRSDDILYFALWADDTIDVPFIGRATDSWKAASPATCLYQTGLTGGLPTFFNQGIGRSGNVPCIEMLPGGGPGV